MMEQQVVLLVHGSWVWSSAPALPSVWSFTCSPSVFLTCQKHVGWWIVQLQITSRCEGVCKCVRHHDCHESVTHPGAVLRYI